MIAAQGYLRHFPLFELRHVTLAVIIIPDDEDTAVLLDQRGVEVAAGHLRHAHAAQLGHRALPVVVAPEQGHRAVILQHRGVELAARYLLNVVLGHLRGGAL